jgi:hypothetical protein
MAKIKYAEDLDPLRKKHYGFTFIHNHYGQTMMQGQRNNRSRYSRQFLRMHNLQKAVRFWRDMSAETKTAWNNFAAAYPQPSKRNPLLFLTGYQLFLKRNHYCFLNHGIETEFMLLPEMVSLPFNAPTFYLTAGSNQIDVTELYIYNFGLIPNVGQWLQFMAVPYSEISGQFFEPIYATLEILNTYLDGFFLNLDVPKGNPDITFSVYLSKPLNPGYNYPSSKVRYMGCFTTKSFLGLSDTPNSYAGQSGKIVKVKADETGLEFGEGGGGGGLTCEDLPACPSFITLQTQLDGIAETLINLNQSSIPPIYFGLLYNHYCTRGTGAASILSEGWHFPTMAEISALATYAGLPANEANKKVKIASGLYWNNITQNNVFLLNLKGSGIRSNVGAFSSIKTISRCWTTTFYTGVKYRNMAVNDNVGPIDVSQPLEEKHGFSITAIKDVTTLSNGQSGLYYGNDGKIYRTICINNQEFIADPLCETLFRDLSPIPWHGATPANYFTNAEWEALTTPGVCVYQNTLSYACENFSFPI